MAHVEDAEEDSGSSVGGIESTRKYAMSEVPRSPIKERPNTGRVRGDRRVIHPDSEEDSLTDSDDTPRSAKKDKARPKDPRRPPHNPRDRERELDREQRDRERRRRERKLREEEDNRKARAQSRDKDRESRTLKKTRPPGPKHALTQPVIQQGPYRRGHFDDPAAYGVQQPAASGSRPRAQTRPASYYAGQPPRPPMANMGWQGPHPPPFPVGTFPPPQMYPMGPPPPSPAGPPSFFEGVPIPHPHGHDHLRYRFDMRPSSAMGFQTNSSIGYPPEEYDYEEEPVHHRTRRPSRTKKADDDRKKMPPPDFFPPKRTQSARPPQTAPFKPPPSQRERPPSRQNQRPSNANNRRSVGFVDQSGFDDSDFLGEEDLFHDMSPEHNYDQRRALARVRRGSVAYEQQGYEIVPANSRARRSSMYGHGALEGGGVSLEEDKYLDALKYQDDVSGGPLVPLTAETLRKASKRGEVASSRSTRSSASRDESEYKRSNTTGLTRSSSGNNNDDFTIKVSGATVVRVSGAEIECNDGGEITVSGRQGAGQGSRTGSDKESTVYQLEDSRSRVERKALTHRPRAPSQSDSQSRSYASSHYDHAPYEQITYEHAPYDPALAASNFY